MQDGSVEPAQRREGRVNVKRVGVAGKAIEGSLKGEGKCYYCHISLIFFPLLRMRMCRNWTDISILISLRLIIAHLIRCGLVLLNDIWLPPIVLIWTLPRLNQQRGVAGTTKATSTNLENGELEQRQSSLSASR